MKWSDERKKLHHFYTLSFTYTFQGPDEVYFAHSFPYTYSDLQNYLNILDNNQNISSFYRRRNLCNTLANNVCDVLTITENCVDPAIIAVRPAIVISSRVHPGETSSSYMMHGIIQYLVSDHIDAKRLRETFVFKLIPMLNPDGVIHGNYRCSLSGADLNRCYADPLPTLHPTICSIKSLLISTHENRGVLLYLDLHGHSKMKNSFIYGCDVALQPSKMFKRELKKRQDDIFSRRLYTRIFPKVLCSISRSDSNGFFSYQDCCFRVQKSKLGTGRVVGWKDLGIEGSYTIEISFCGNGDNTEAKLLKKAFGKKSANSSFALGSYLPIPPTIDGASTCGVGVVSCGEVVEEDLLCEEDDGSLGDDEAAGGGAGGGIPSASTTPPITRCPSRSSEVNALESLLESYKTAKHYTQQNLRDMGRDLCISLLYFCNRQPTVSLNENSTGERTEASLNSKFRRRSFELNNINDSKVSDHSNCDNSDSFQTQMGNLQYESSIRFVPKIVPFASTSSKSSRNDALSDFVPFSNSSVRIDTLSEAELTKPILRPAVFSVDTIKSTLKECILSSESISSSSTTGLLRDVLGTSTAMNPYMNLSMHGIQGDNNSNSNSNNSGFNPALPLSLRMLSEMFIRSALHDEYSRLRPRLKTNSEDDSKSSVDGNNSTDVKIINNLTIGNGSILDPLAIDTAFAEGEFSNILNDEIETILNDDIEQMDDKNDGSDSDPSGDNLPLSKLLRNKAFRKFSEKVHLTISDMMSYSSVLTKNSKRSKRKKQKSKRNERPSHRRRDSHHRLLTDSHARKLTTAAATSEISTSKFKVEPIIQILPPPKPKRNTVVDVPRYLAAPVQPRMYLNPSSSLAVGLEAARGTRYVVSSQRMNPNQNTSIKSTTALPVRSMFLDAEWTGPRRQQHPSQLSAYSSVRLDAQSSVAPTSNVIAGNALPRRASLTRSETFNNRNNISIGNASGAASTCGGGGNSSNFTATNMNVSRTPEPSLTARSRPLANNKSPADRDRLPLRVSTNKEVNLTNSNRLEKGPVVQPYECMKERMSIGNVDLPFTVDTSFSALACPPMCNEEDSATAALFKPKTNLNSLPLLSSPPPTSSGAVTFTGLPRPDAVTMRQPSSLSTTPKIVTSRITSSFSSPSLYTLGNQSKGAGVTRLGSANGVGNVTGSNKSDRKDYR